MCVKRTGAAAAQAYMICIGANPQDWRVAGTSTSLPDAASINICKVNYCEEADSVAVVSGVGLIAAATPGGLATWSVSVAMTHHAHWLSQCSAPRLRALVD